MKFKKYKAEYEGKTFVAEQDLPNVGWHLYVYKDGKNTHDFLQDTKEIAMSQANDDFGVPLNIWVELENDENS